MNRTWFTPGLPGPPSPGVSQRSVGLCLCPLNYVKTKMALAPLQSGQTLAVLVDADGARNVPDSVAKDGHEIVSVTQSENTYRIFIRKRG
jgi:TusA-related sulfurtransferase